MFLYTKWEIAILINEFRWKMVNHLYIFRLRSRIGDAYWEGRFEWRLQTRSLLVIGSRVIF